MKLTGPMFSLDARGTIGSAITFSFWKGVNYARARVIPNNPKTADQTKIRDLITDASVAWKLGSTVGGVTIDASYKLAYTTAAAGMAKSGFNLYIADAVAKNGGSAYDGSLALPTEPGDQTP